MRARDMSCKRKLQILRCLFQTIRENARIMDQHIDRIRGKQVRGPLDRIQIRHIDLNRLHPTAAGRIFDFRFCGGSPLGIAT